MVDCAYCEKPLICESCGAEYLPPTLEHYVALSERDSLLDCPACGSVLICHWCKTPYDGTVEDEEDSAAD